ncbi:MAG: transcription elongation factor, GreA/GreB, C-term family protein [Hydrocarboniphaga sp.]|uniref:GreA/GreB family elongation factor n=1 Tax=Hydrocarboniphaga sp. TaxID=2033016 RepID=UPI00262A44BE|nr:GreA/GreB family elongation factor [Hydrocarboniphaga sp.]MDB5971056.1 transcription elongation factor, GreA/GreB, C-term family protein [Hydrocarboniphaga sp.]
MSRAFVKESDTPADDTGDMPLSSHPNYVTPRGLRLLRERFDTCQRRLALIGDAPLHAGERSSLQRELRWLQARLLAAIELSSEPDYRPERVAFGHCIELVELESGTRHRYRIVGEDEADPAEGLLSWVAPLARAVDGAKRGDIVTWPRPAGDLDVRIADIGVADD